MKLPYGNSVRIGNYKILKYSKSLNKKELGILRGNMDKVPAHAKESLQRGSLPYIKISTISGSWSVEFVIGTTMYEAINAIPVAKDDEGVLTYYGNGYNNLYHTFNAMLADTTTVGDEEYQVAKQKLLTEYLNRAAKVRLEEEKTKDEELLRKESDDAAQQVLDRERHAEKLLEMADEIKKQEEEKI